MGERLSAEDRESLCICADFAGLLDHDRVKRICKRRGEKAVERIVAAAVAEERERIARVLLDGMPDPAFDSRYRDGYAAAIFMVERLAKGLKP